MKNKNALRGGMYSLAATAIVLAILVVLNIFVSVLPDNLTKLDISSQKLYSVTSNTKAVVNALDKDVDIYWIVQDGKEDAVLENLLNKYDAMSDHIHLTKKNPDVFPTFASQYTDDTVANNSLVVECGDRSRYIGFDSIYLSDIDSSYYTQSYSFDGEGQITSAINYVVSDDSSHVYTLTGHGEAELTDNLKNEIKKDNADIESISLLNEDNIPDDADCIIINAPASDISETERDMLKSYADKGGKLFVFAGPTQSGTLSNLYSLMADYGVEPVDGVVVEGDREHYALQAPYVLLPDIESSDITDPIVNDNYKVVVAIAQGMKVSDTSHAKELLVTSDDSFCKAEGLNIKSYEKEAGDASGPFALAVSVSTENDGKIIWVSSSAFTDELYNAYSSGANLNFCMNALSSLIGDDEHIAIRTKSLGYNYLTINASDAALLKAIMIGIIPAFFVAAGIAVVLVRRRKKNG